MLSPTTPPLTHAQVYSNSEVVRPKTPVLSHGGNKFMCFVLELLALRVGALMIFVGTMVANPADSPGFVTTLGQSTMVLGIILAGISTICFIREIVTN